LAGVPADMNGSKFLQEELLWPRPSHLNPGVAAPQIAAHLVKSAQNTAHKSLILIKKNELKSLLGLLSFDFLHHQIALTQMYRRNQ